MSSARKEETPSPPTGTDSDSNDGDDYFMKPDAAGNDSDGDGGKKRQRRYLINPSGKTDTEKGFFDDPDDDVNLTAKISVIIYLLIHQTVPFGFLSCFCLNSTSLYVTFQLT